MPAINSRMMPKSHPSKNHRSTSAHSSNNRNENNVSARVSAEIQSATFLGPIPHPAILEGYEKIVPGAAERILIMAESSMKHQQQYDNALLEASRKQAARGQILGFLIGLSAIGASMFSAFIGYPVLAGILGGTTVVSLVVAFVVGRMVKNGEM